LAATKVDKSAKHEHLVKCALSKTFEVVGLGGTFDEFHKGHRALLTKAFEVSERIIIGLATDAFVEKLGKPHNFAKYSVRLEELKSFLKKQGWIDRAKIIPIKTIYGNTLTSKQIEGIVVSRETASTAYEINEKRKAKGLKPLSIIVIDMVPAYNSKPISTTRIRFMEIDREGHQLKHEN
jgi:pantetheine-phosphate adenylyltransferase